MFLHLRTYVHAFSSMPHWFWILMPHVCHSNAIVAACPRRSGPVESPLCFRNRSEYEAFLSCFCAEVSE